MPLRLWGSSEAHCLPQHLVKSGPFLWLCSIPHQSLPGRGASCGCRGHTWSSQLQLGWDEKWKHDRYLGRWGSVFPLRAASAIDCPQGSCLIILETGAFWNFKVARKFAKVQMLPQQVWKGQEPAFLRSFWVCRNCRPEAHRRTKNSTTCDCSMTTRKTPWDDDRGQQNAS